MVAGMLLAASILVALALVVAGVLVDRDQFVPAALASLVGFFVGVPLAIWLVRRQRFENERSEHRDRERELHLLKRAGRVEADRIIEMVAAAEKFLADDRPVPPIDRIVGYWSELLGPRFYALTANDGPLHDLRQAHARLDETVTHLDAAEQPSPPDDPKRLRSQAGISARRARTWAEHAKRELEAATLTEDA